jgi:cytochrome c-type biogenesis protein CcmH/NrfG
MIMRRAFIIAALCFLLIPFGCRRTASRKIPAVPASTESPKEHGVLRSPYYAGLIEEYRTVLAKDSNNLAAITALGNAYFATGQWKNAITTYEQALLIDAKNADVRVALGTAYLNIGMTDRALVEYRTALRLDPVHVDALYNTGVIYARNKKDYKEAVRIWEDLLKIAPNYPRAEQVHSMIATIKTSIKKDDR